MISLHLSSLPISPLISLKCIYLHCNIFDMVRVFIGGKISPAFIVKVFWVILPCLIKLCFGFSYISRVFSGRIWRSFIYDTVSSPVSSKIFCASICQANKGTCQLFVMDGSVCHLGIYVRNNTFLAPQTRSKVVNIDYQVFNGALETLLVVGGSVVNGTGGVEALDMSGFNRTCPAIANIPTTLGQTGIFLDGQSIVCAGSPTLDRCYSYDNSSDDWNEIIMSMNVRRLFPAGIKLSQKEFWITGGWEGLPWIPFDSTEIYDAITSNITDFISLPIGMENHNVIDFNETHIFFSGMERVYLFEKSSQDFLPMPDLHISRQRSHAGIVKMVNGSNYIVVAGGLGENTTEWWNIDKQPEWVFGPSLPIGELFGGVHVPYFDTFLIVGGISGGETQETIFYFDIDSNEWETWHQNLSRAARYGTAFMVPNSYIKCTLDLH